MNKDFLIIGIHFIVILDRISNEKYGGLFFWYYFTFLRFLFFTTHSTLLSTKCKKATPYLPFIDIFFIPILDRISNEKYGGLIGLHSIAWSTLNFNSKNPQIKFMSVCSPDSYFPLIVREVL